MPAVHQADRRQVDRHRDQRGPHDGCTVDDAGIEQAAHRLPHQEPGDDQDRRGIGLSGQNRRPVVPERAPRRRRPHGEREREQRDEDRGNVGEVVTGVGEQPDRVDRDADDDLHDDEREVDPEHHPQPRPSVHGDIVGMFPSVPLSSGRLSPRLSSRRVRRMLSTTPATSMATMTPSDR